MSEDLVKQTIAAIYDFCDLFIENESLKQKILNHISNIFQNWSESWIIIKKWLNEIIFLNKEYVLSSFIERIPELHIFKDVITKLLEHHPAFWNEIYNNLIKCKNCLHKE